MGLLLLNDDYTVDPTPPVPSLDFLSLNGARRLVYQHWIDGWTGPTTKFDNMAGREAATGSSHVTFLVRELSSGQSTLGVVGNRKFERQAVIIATIYVPSDEGTETADELAEAVRNLFEGVTLDGGLCIYRSEIAEGGTEGHWYSIVVRSYFTYYVTK